MNQMEFRAIKRRLEDGRYFWGLFCADKDGFLPPSAAAADRAAALSGFMGSASDPDAQLTNNAAGTGSDIRLSAEQLNETGGPGVQATVIKANAWLKSGGRARVRPC